MGKKTQGTQMYTIDPDTNEILDIGCVTAISGIDTQIDQIETTCLSDKSRTYEAGLGTPGTASFTIQVDPENPVHVRLHELKTAGTTLPWAIGWSESEAPPTEHTDSNGEGDFVLPTSRSWLTFEGYMNAFPFDFAANTMVTSAIGVQVSGDPVLVPKAA